MDEDAGAFGEGGHGVLVHDTFAGAGHGDPGELVLSSSHTMALGSSSILGYGGRGGGGGEGGDEAAEMEGESAGGGTKKFAKR